MTLFQIKLQLKKIIFSTTFIFIAASSPVQREEGRGGYGALPRAVLAWRSRSRSRQREGPRRAQRHYFFLLKLSAFPSHAAQRDREARIIIVAPAQLNVL